MLDEETSTGNRFPLERRIVREREDDAVVVVLILDAIGGLLR